MGIKDPKPPVVSFEDNGIEVALWEKPSTKVEGGIYYSIRVCRRYQTDTGGWKPTTYYLPSELDTLSDLVAKAQKFIKKSKKKSCKTKTKTNAKAKDEDGTTSF